jgi:hypothetical protein
MSIHIPAYNRMLATNLRAFELEITQTVGRKFARMLEMMQAGEEVDIPAIGGKFPPPEYRTPKYFDELQAEIIRACVARKWFTFEAPPWAQPLPLTQEDCEALFNIKEAENHGREYLVGEYGICLRSLGWHYERASKFEVYCANKLRPPGFW